MPAFVFRSLLLAAPFALTACLSTTSEEETSSSQVPSEVNVAAQAQDGPGFDPSDIGLNPIHEVLSSAPSFRPSRDPADFPIGKVTPFRTVNNSEETARLFVAVYDWATGWVETYPADNGIGTRVARVQVGTGYTTVAAYDRGSSNYMVFYNSGTGAYAIRSLSRGGTPGGVLHSGTWGKYWLNIEMYGSGASRFLIFHHKGMPFPPVSPAPNPAQIRIYRVDSDGSLGERTWDGGTLGYNFAQPYFVRVDGVLKPFLYMHSDFEQVAKTYRLDSDGTLGSFLESRSFSWGWRHRIFHSGTTTTLVRCMQQRCESTDLDQTGFMNFQKAYPVTTFFPSSVTGLKAAFNPFDTEGIMLPNGGSIDDPWGRPDHGFKHVAAIGLLDEPNETVLARIYPWW